MATLNIPLLDAREQDFVLYDVLDVESLGAYNRFAEHSRETFDRALSTARLIAENEFAPHNRKSDLNEPQLIDGRVTLIPEIAGALGSFADAGFFAAHQDYERGGMQLPWVITQACMCWFYGANVATTAYAFLTIAAANLLDAFASDSQKARYMLPMLDGRFFGTMALSEPQAGSSLGDISATAEPREDDLYRINGGKMWISGAAHELSENIVNLVLARIKGAPPGVKGLSLFIVPRYRLNVDGSNAEFNHVSVIGLNHKMGYRGTTNTVLSFGDGGECTGELIGRPHHGLSYMFHMMNEARIVVGLSSTMLGLAGHRYSLEYARNRRQGRSATRKVGNSVPIAIIEHADVRRMLLTQRSYVEAGFALGLYCALLVDRQKNDTDATVREHSRLLLEFLTPVFKSSSSEYALIANDLAIQILGGYGYTRDFPVEQYWRDNRLNPIHEGTNGIQAIDLLGRKAQMSGGLALALFIEQVRKTATDASTVPNLAAHAQSLDIAVVHLETISRYLIGAVDHVGIEKVLANAKPYLDIVGTITFAWMWLKQAIAASHNMATTATELHSFYRGKLQTCKYFFQWEIPKVAVLVDAVKRLETTWFEMDAAWF